VQARVVSFNDTGMPLRIDILTLFPEMFGPLLGSSIPKRAAEKGLVEYHLTNFRDFATDAHKSVDDKPFGGGPGMLMMCRTTLDAVTAAEKQDPRPPVRIMLGPQGRRFDQAMAEDFARRERLLIIAGHYEGFDERIIQTLVPIEVSVGDFVLSGGEVAAMVIVDAVVRLLPGALGAEQSAIDETFADGLLEYPQYTRPREFGGMSVPEVLLSGDHGKIAQWRLEQRRLRTKERRPDLWAAYVEKNAVLLEAERARAERKLNRKKRKPGVGGAEPGTVE
jgi:tRNA (guanine37-N1)-methyltransferase